MGDQKRRSGEHKYEPDPVNKPPDEVTTTRVRNIAIDAAEDALDKSMPGILQGINAKVDLILDRLAKGDTIIALLAHRVQFLEKIVFGVSAVSGLTIVGAVLALIIHH